MNVPNFNKLNSPQNNKNDGKNYNPSKRLAFSKEIPQSQVHTNNPKLPSHLQKIKNVVSTAVDVVKETIKGTSVKADVALTTTRLKTCMSCEFYIQNRDRCSKCGCKMKIKTSLTASKCPVGKW